MLPFLSISIFSAAGILGNPGIVMTAPVRITTNPAQAFTNASRTWISNPSGRPNFV